jgi:hypothetical protein
MALAHLRLQRCDTLFHHDGLLSQEQGFCLGLVQRDLQRFALGGNDELAASVLHVSLG